MTQGTDAQQAFMAMLSELREIRAVMKALSSQIVVLIESQGSLSVEVAELGELLKGRRENKIERAAGAALDALLGLPPKKRK